MMKLLLACALFAASTAAPIHSVPSWVSRRLLGAEVCVPTTAPKPLCHICVNKQYFQAGCQGINQLLCAGRGKKTACLADGLCMWWDAKGGRCNDVNVQHCPGAGPGLQQCLNYKTGAWKVDAACDTTRIACEKCVDGACTSPTPTPTPTPTPPSPTPTPTPPAGCKAAEGRPNGCACTHKWECKSAYCSGVPAKCSTPPALFAEATTVPPKLYHNIEDETKCDDVSADITTLAGEEWWLANGYKYYGVGGNKPWDSGLCPNPPYNFTQQSYQPSGIASVTIRIMGVGGPPPPPVGF